MRIGHLQREIEELRARIPRKPAHAAGAAGMKAPLGGVTPAMKRACRIACGRWRKSRSWPTKSRPMNPYDPTGTTGRKIMAFSLMAPSRRAPRRRLREILNMLAVVLVFILAYAWLDEIQALVGHPFG